MSFRVVAIPTKVADLVRSSLCSPGYGHPAHVELAAGYGPCRHCLHTFRVGEEKRILFTYDPFHEIDSVPLPGPIFVHAESCERYAELAGFPEDLRAHGLTLAAYGTERRLREEKHVRDGHVEPVLDQLLARSDVQYVHVRDLEAGCYDCRIERNQELE